MSNIVVDSSASLIAAVKLAKDGDTILLKDGDYKSVNLSNIKINGNVTISSLDKDHQANLLDLTVKNSSGLNFDHLQFTPQSVDRQYTFNVTGSSNIHFDSIELTGPAGEMGYKSSAFMIRGSDNVSVTNSEFHHLQHGMSVLDSTNVSITENYLHDIRTDGIRGGGNSYLTISSNYMTDFFPAAGDHPDGIQLWTTNTTKSAHDIVISDNIITRGDGAVVQGIFLRDQVGTLPYKNVAITGNLVLGGMYNGIAVSHVEDLTITDNSVVALPGMKSWIAVYLSDGVVADNKATGYILSTTSNPDLATSGNSTVSVPTDGGVATLTTWLLAHQSDLSDLGSLLTDVLGVDELLASLTVADADKVTVVATPVVTDVPTVTEPPVVPTEPVITTIIGTDKGETLSVAKSGDSIINAGGGNDTLHGGAGANTLNGGDGDDSYHVKGNGDVVVEDASGGNDTVYAYVDHVLADNVETLRMASEGLIGTGNAMNNRMVGSAGSDTFHGADGNDTIQGEGGDDVIYGDAGNDKLLGGDGTDALSGGDGDDVLFGNDGNDILLGGAGNDTIESGAGSDILAGGTGADNFIFRLVDPTNTPTITDFSSAEKDKVSLSLIDANANTAANDTFRFIGTGDFTKVAGQLRYEVVNGDAHVMGDVNGDGVADFSITLQRVDTLRAGDFFL